MFKRLIRMFSHPMLALVSTLAWGLIEFLALQGSRRVMRSRRTVH